MEKWRSGEVEKWRSGEVEKWRSGEVEKWCVSDEVQKTPQPPTTSSNARPTAKQATVMAMRVTFSPLLIRIRSAEVTDLAYVLIVLGL